MTVQESERSVITASEVHEYFYCPYAWWYAVRGIEPERKQQLQRGLEYHDAIAATAGKPATWSWALLAAAGVLAVAAIVLHLLGMW